MALRTRSRTDPQPQPSPGSWAPPAELLRYPPRTVRLTPAGRLVAAAAAALMAGSLVSGIWLYVAAARAVDRLQRIARHGVETTAEVVRIGRTGGKHPRRIVYFRYRAEGRSHQGRAILSQRDRRDLPPGTSLPAVYLPERPGEAWLRGYAPGGAPVWAAPLVSIGLLGGAAPIWLAIRRQRALLACGRPAQARVTGVRKVRASGRGSAADTVFRVSYDYFILSGAARTGRYDKSKNPPEPGSVLTVIYDPDNPGRSARYPLPLVRVAHG